MALRGVGEHRAVMVAKHPQGEDSEEAQRLRLLVRVMEFETSADFARWLKVDPRRWNNFEVGYPLSLDMARKLVARIPGLSFDWLFSGRPDGLSVEMARKLGEARVSNVTPIAASRRKKRA